MAVDLKKTRTYRLVYFQPDPEDGDRVCIGLLFRDNREYAIVYDNSFPKLACIAPLSEKSVLKFYLDELEDLLRNATREEERLILKKFEPQIIASEERVLLSAVTASLKQRLLERFAIGSSHFAGVTAHIAEEAGPTYQQATDESIASFVREFVPASNVMFRARAKQIVGRTLPNVAPVAASVRTSGKIVLIDGVDLKVASAKQVLNRVSKVTHTFWEYGKAEREHLLTGQESLQRVALVLNGVPHYSSAQKDAQDFALHQFGNEADLVLTERTRDDGRLRDLLKAQN